MIFFKNLKNDCFAMDIFLKCQICGLNDGYHSRLVNYWYRPYLPCNLKNSHTQPMTKSLAEVGVWLKWGLLTKLKNTKYVFELYFISTFSFNCSFPSLRFVFSQYPKLMNLVDMPKIWRLIFTNGKYFCKWKRWICDAGGFLLENRKSVSAAVDTAHR